MQSLYISKLDKVINYIIYEILSVDYDFKHVFKVALSFPINKFQKNNILRN